MQVGHVTVVVLGPLSVTAGGAIVDLGRPQTRLVLAHLLSQQGHRLRRDELIERIWPDHDPSRAGHSLNVHISELRKRLPSDAGIALETTADGYHLRLPPGSLDRESFRDLASAGQFEQALDAWTGRAFEGLSDRAGIDQATAALEAERRDVLASWAEEELSSGRANGIASRIEPELEIDPFDERLWALLMRAHYACGVPAKALAAFRRVRRLLGEELGVEPGPALQDLEEQVLLHDPRLRSSDRPTKPARRLPTERTQLIGREGDVSALLERLDASRVVTIVGPGGAGKTRLAIRIAHVLHEDDHDVHFVELGSLTTSDQIMGSLVASMGLADVRGTSAENVLSSWLADRSAVVVLDNCEHLVAGVADAVDHLVECGPGVRILATSRQPIGVRGESIWHLGSLAAPPPEFSSPPAGFGAVDLFVERALSQVADFDPTLHLDAIASLVRKLDGLPLAIELAAALVSAMHPSEIESALADGIDILDRGARTAPARHRSLEQTVAWSEELMSPDERVLFRRLSVFAGRFGVGAASAVCGFGDLDERQTRRVLARLVAKSLVVADRAATETSFHLLETVRAVSRARLEEAVDADETAERYLQHYTEKAQEFGWMASSERRDEALAWASREFDNIAASVGRMYDDGEVESPLIIASSLARVITALGRYRTVVDWIERGLAAGASSVDAKVLAPAQVVLTMAGAERPGSAAAGESAYEHLLREGAHAGAARAAYALTYNASFRGDVESAERWSTLAVEHARASGSKATLAWVLPINVVYRLAVPRRALSDEEIAAAMADLDTVDALIGPIDNAELPICAEIARIAVRVLVKDADPLADIEPHGWVSDAPYYLPVARDMMRSAAALEIDDMETAIALLLDAAGSQKDSFQVRARRSMLKIYAAAAVRLGLWELAARLFRAAGDANPVLVYGMFFDPGPYHEHLLDHLDDVELLEDAEALDVDDALDLFVDTVHG